MAQPASPVDPALPSDGNVFAELHEILEAPAWAVAGRVALVLAAVAWLASGYAVYRDARRRLASPALVGAAVALALAAPLVGVLLYRLFRPPEYLEHVRARTLGMRALETAARATPRCHACGSVAGPAFLSCPLCAARLRVPCEACGRPLEASWRVCPACAEPAPSPGAGFPEPLPPEAPRRASAPVPRVAALDERPLTDV